MKLALLASNGETVALASRLISGGASACTAEAGKPLPACDWLLFDESTPLSSTEARTATRHLLGEALAAGKPLFAFLSPNAPVTPKCAIVMTELLGFSSAAAVTPSGASDILGLDGNADSDPRISETFGDDVCLTHAAALAKELSDTFDLTFSLVFDPDESRGVLFAGDAYNTTVAESIEGAIASLFRTTPEH
ncbi:MAG: hypothetical protein IKC26_00830 [Clostridia bacterium]|nr:hypothetical protein [Clostridia bacterium]